MNISLKRDSAENINAIEKKDRQILIETDKGEENKIYYDNGTDRCTYGGYAKVDTELNTISENLLENRVATKGVNNLLDSSNKLLTDVRKVRSDITDFSYNINHAKILWQRPSNVWGTPDYNGQAITTYNLSEKISEQNFGIIVVFSAMNKETQTKYKPVCTPQNWYFISEFIPKYYVNKYSSRGYSFQLFGSNEFSWRTGLKYMYIYDDKLVENENNFNSPVNNKGEWVPVVGKNGISYATDLYCVRYILGV